MYYVVLGSDGMKARAKARSIADALQNKKPDATFFTLTNETFDIQTIDELVGGQGLFERKHVVFFDHVLENVEAKVMILKRIADIAASENLFLFLEGVLDSKTQKKLSDHAEKSQVLTASEKKVPAFQIFALSEAFGHRDRKMLWVLYQKARRENIAPEEIHGTLFWQLKSMLVAAETTPTESGLNPFVYKKSAAFVKNYGLADLRRLSSELVTLYHDARRGLFDFDTALERFVLTI